MLAHAKRRAAVWKLLEYMASSAWQTKAAIVTGNYPILSSLYDDQVLQQRMQDFPLYGEQFKYLVTRLQLVSYARVSGILQTHLHQLLLRKVSPKAAMEAAIDEVNRASATP